ncbi:hypothetical protein EJD97_023914 [Solanum chilense]|uniref:Uncharacterized protein n=1 Tax=Solanum chilense TaxID=4083 RepID=A0A6N2ARD9_SOLCI|nr:hypothetical protein EJD97_023914 [Solanum chilense]
MVNALKESRLKIKEQGWDAQGVVPQASGTWVAHSWHRTSSSRTLGGHAQGIALQAPVAWVASSWRHSSNILNLRIAIKELFLNLQEADWHAQGVALQPLGALVANSGHCPSSSGSLVAHSRRCASCSCSVPGTLKGVAPQAQRAWLAHSKYFTSSSEGLEGLLRHCSSSFRILGGALMKYPSRFRSLVGVLKESYHMLREPRLRARGITPHVPGALAQCLKLSVPWWHAQDVEPLELGSWGRLWRCSSSSSSLGVMRQEPSSCTQGIAPHDSGASAHSVVPRTLGSKVARSGHCYLDFWDLGWRAHGIILQAPNTGREPGRLSGLRALRFVSMGGALRDIGWSAHEVVPLDPVTWRACLGHCASSSSSHGGVLKASCSCRHSSSFLTPCAALRESCIKLMEPGSITLGGALKVLHFKLREPGWRTKGIVPQVLGAWFERLGRRATRTGILVGALKPYRRAQGVAPQAQGASLTHSRNHSSGSRTFDGALRASCLKLDYLGFHTQGVTPHALVAWLAPSKCLAQSVAPQTLGIFGGELRTLHLNLCEPGWLTQRVVGFAP